MYISNQGATLWQNRTKKKQRNAPVQRNTRSENKLIKDGETLEAWKENPVKISQKDVDARWGNKHESYTFGYKAHVGTDVKYKLVRDVATTSADVHDSNVYGQLVKNSSKDVYADSGYVESSDPLPEGYREHPFS